MTSALRRAHVIPVLLASLAAGCAAPADHTSDTSVTAASMSDRADSAALLGLRTAKYTARDLTAAKSWYSEVLGIAPYFDEPFYVGFNVGGYELGITPDTAAATDRPEAGVAYWGVTNADSAYARLLTLGATEFEPIQDVGDGIRIGAVRDPFGNILGVIENPHFRLP
jgi:predicted enzyme related to lactoylglutathione lyase